MVVERPPQTQKRAETARLIPQSAETKRSLSRNGVLENVRILDAGELDRKAAVEVAHHPPGRLADPHERSDRRPVVADDRNARYRKVDDAAAFLAARLHPHPGGLVAG